MTGYRLTTGGRRIDRAAAITFELDGRQLHGFRGDTLASAIMANGCKGTARSFKYHRPRAQMANGWAEANLLFDIETSRGCWPNCPATLVPLEQGLVARSSTGRPGLRDDRWAILQTLKRFIPTGFYYKTFIRPDWTMFEDRIRALAGHGRVSPDARGESAARTHAFADCLVIGLGDQGQHAARQALANGETVITIDPEHDDAPHGARHITGFAFALSRDLHCQAFASNDTYWKVRARRIILATGHQELPVVFPHNDRPGVMLASAMLAGLRDHAVMPGKQPALCGPNADITDLKSALGDAGIEPVAQIDPATGSRIIDVAFKRGQITSLTLSDGNQRRTIACDCIATSGGFTPNLQLLGSLGCALKSVEQGRRLSASDIPANIELAFSERSDETPPAFDFILSAPQFVDFQNDVTLGDIALAHREGFRSVEHLKRYTTLGMAGDQGRTSNVTGLSALAQLRQDAPHAVGSTRYRPPIAPVPLPAFAAYRRGRLFAPLKYLPTHAQQVETSALMEDHGGWYRPTCYLRDGGTPADAIQREARVVRNHCGMMDASPLGKLEVFGTDAAEFVDRVYLQTMRTLKPGRIRYGLMLRDDGSIMDDGVVTRIADDHYLLGTTSGGVAAVYAHLERLRQVDWPHLDVVIADVTSQWGVLTVTGPDARDVVAALGCSAAIGRETFAHLDFRSARIGDCEARLSRVSFTGELSYEIAVPADLMPSLWRAALGAGAVPFGLDALMVLRTEKGFIHVGTDTDPSTRPDDLGFGMIARRKKSDFVGRGALFRSEAMRQGRLQLVGLHGEEHSLPVGAHILSNAPANDLPSDGFVTSPAFSVTRNRPIALALLADGRNRIGETVTLVDDGNHFTAVVAEPCFYDPEQERVND